MTTTRILLIDDNQDIHEDFRKVFAFTSQRDGDLDDLEADLFGNAAPKTATAGTELDIEFESAFQGQDGVDMVERAIEEDRPYSLAFVDVRMPPGLDGVQTIKQIWGKHPDLQCVICTAYSDYDWDEISSELGATSNLLILKKPFDAIEVLQIVHALAEKHRLSQQQLSYERELKQKLDELRQVQDQLVGKNDELAAARQKAESHSEAKSQFLANVSHELRTPLNGVIGMVELLLQTTLKTQQRKYARTIKSSAELLLEMLNEVLDFSKIEAGKIELEEIDFDLAQLTESIVRVVAHKCQEKKIELSYYIEPRLRCGLRGDPSRIRQILLNLVNNAVKFTDHGEVTIEIVLAEQNGSDMNVRFQVTDTGIGIPEHAQDRLFKAFSQVDSSTSRKYGGTGLGLAICKQLTEIMGGEIGVDTTAGEGSKFWFFLPLKPAEQESTKRMTVPAPFAESRILIVDDSRTHSELLTMQLTSWGFDASPANSGGQALEMLCRAAADKTPFQVALIDESMAGMSGSELAIAVKANARLRDAALIVMLPLDSGNDAMRFQSQGFSDYISKPIMQSELFDTLLRTVRAQLSGETLQWQRQEKHESSSFPTIQHPDARILVTEDNEVNLEVALEILTKTGYSCEAARNGEEAVKLISHHEFDLVLMDMQMPTMDGLEATEAIRQRGFKIPIIALTANAMTSDRERCLKAGMDDYLSKPLDPVKMIRTIESWLDRVNGHAPTQVVATTEPDEDSVEEPQIPQDAPIDLDCLAERCMGNLEFAGRMLQKFVDGSAEELRQLEEAVAEGNADRIASLAHTLKGLAGNLAADRLREKVSRLEEAARAGEVADISDQLDDVRAELDESVSFAARTLPIEL